MHTVVNSFVPVLVGDTHRLATRIQMDTYIHVYIYTYTCIYIYIYMFSFPLLSLYTYICMYVCR